MSVQNAIELHKQFKQLVQLAYHIGYKSSAYLTNKVVIDNSDYRLSISYDTEDVSISLSINGHSPIFEVTLFRPCCDNTCESSVNIMHNDMLGRYSYSSNIYDENPLCTFATNNVRDEFIDIPLFSTEEELFQLSTVRECPTFEKLQSLSQITEVYDCIPITVSFLMRTREHDLSDYFIEELISKAWSILPVLIRKQYVTSEE